MSLVFGLGLELSCPWLRECLSSKRLSLALDFFCGLGLEPCVLDSISGSKRSAANCTESNGLNLFLRLPPLTELKELFQEEASFFLDNEL